MSPSSTRSARATSRLRRRVSAGRLVVRIGVLLTLLSLIPLAGATWVTALEIGETRAERSRAQELEAGVSQLVAITELRSLLLAERNWNGVRLGLESVGIALAVANAALGLDIEYELTKARTGVDDLVDALEMDDVAGELAVYRRADSQDMDRVADIYNALEAEVADQGHQVFEQLLVQAADSTGGGATVQALRVLDAAAVAQESVGSQQSAYFSARFAPIAIVPVDVANLIEERARRHAALVTLALVAEPGSGALDELARIEASPAVQLFDAATLDYVTGYLASPTPDGPEPLEAVSAEESEDLAAMYGFSKDSADLHLALVDAAAGDVEMAIGVLLAAADQQAREALLAGLALALTTLAFTAAVIRMVASPLHQLAQTAQELRDGRTGHQMKVAGPAEVRAAALAINEASLHLDLVERQARALAEGQLDHESLAQTAHGAIGRSLQDAVQTLTASLTDREQFRLQLAFEAQHDALTGLPNRKACLDHLMVRLRDGDSHLAALFIDLDGFKDVNDDYGHQAGDAVLVATARRLEQSVRQGDHVGRLGGDEFLVVADPIASQEEGIQLAERLMAALVAPIDAGPAMVRVDASIGIALPGVHHQAPDELIREADLALYEAKSSGRGRVVLCDDRLLAAKDEQVALEAALERAIREHELTLYYQPIVEADRYRIVGLEALVRWRQPGRGIVGPDRFIPVAERSELISRLDRWVVAAVARQLHVWRDDPVRGALPVSVNLSGRTLGSDDVVRDILAPLAARGVDPARIVVEVTESALLDDLTLAGERLGQLRAAGMHVAIDDYGTGFTSLAHLRALPIDVLKIDRTFVDDEAEGRLTQLIIDTGHLLGAVVTAEGVETAAQAGLLRSLGADRLQGYLFGRPLPPEALNLGPGPEHTLWPVTAAVVTDGA